MASFMESQKPKVFTTSNADGVKRVLESPGKIITFIESLVSPLFAIVLFRTICFFDGVQFYSVSDRTELRTNPDWRTT